MINNPILYDPVVRTHHILLCLLMGITYGISAGISTGISNIGMATDVIICIPLFFVEALMLWSVFTFSRLEILDYYQSLAIHAVYVVLAMILMAGGEYLALLVISPDDTDCFISSLPIRVFTMIAIYTSFRRYYESNKIAEEDIQDEVAEDEDMPVVQEQCVKTRITVKVGNKIKVIPVEDLIFIKAEDDYVNVFTAEGHWLKSERLKEYEASLPCEMFARVHRSYIVNMTKIAKIERYGQKQLLFMNNGEQIRISATGYKVLKEKLNL